MVNDGLRLLDLTTSDGELTSGLVPVGETCDKLNIDEKAAIDYAAINFKSIKYIFFRRFTKERSSQILAYIVDNSDGKLDQQSLADLHEDVWFQGLAPLLYVISKNKVDIFACAREPDFWKGGIEKRIYNPEKTIDLLKTSVEINNDLQRFSALRLADGTFWEDEQNENLLKYSESSHQMLIQAIVETDKQIGGENQPILRRLLLLTVLIKYLEDRKVFKEHFFEEIQSEAKDFFDILRCGDPQKLFTLLEKLETKFNGDIFALPQEAKQVLNSDVLLRFANLVEAQTITYQRSFWKQFSFRHIPIEVISNLYQHFIKGKHGAFYTPPLLVALLLDFAMPYAKMTGNERVIDPACGSGIFLVGAFRRLVNHWRSQNSWEKPDVTVLKNILDRSIYGVDLDKDAIDLTSFSLSLAICDALQPEVIWDKLRFDKLKGSHLLEDDFFSVFLSKDDAKSFISEGFDIVVGNPPFESELTQSGCKIVEKARKLDKEFKLPDNNSAYLFLYCSFYLIKGNGRICLIQPAGFLYNRNTEEFRKLCLRQHSVDTIFDFVSIRGLFDSSDVKIIAVLAENQVPNKDNLISHLTFRRTISIKEKLCFELDYYDFHQVEQQQAENQSFVWRCDLLGDARLSEISKRLQNLPTIAQLIKQKGWEYGEGFIVGEKIEETINDKKKIWRTPAPFLTKQPMLPLKAFTDRGIDESKIITNEETLFHTAYTEERYKSPIILFRKIETLPIALWEKNFIGYNHSIVGIHAPETKSQELLELFDEINKNYYIYRFLIILNSTAIAGHSTSILKKDIDSLPSTKVMSELTFSTWENVLIEDVVKYMTEYIREGQNSILLRRTAKRSDFASYSEIFLDLVQNIYKNIKVADPFCFDGLACQPFYFGEKPDLSTLKGLSEIDLRKIIYRDDLYRRLRTVRLLRFYSENVLLIIKPDRLRYWIRSTAIRDANDSIIDLYGQGF